MPKASKAAFYAVHRGHKAGVYASWADCEQQIKGYPNASHKKFSTELGAMTFVERGPASGEVAAAAGRRSASSLSRQKSLGAPVTADRTTYMAKKRGRQITKTDDIIDESEWDVVFTDGACQRNGRVGAVAGIGVWWGVNDPRNLAERCPGDQTNNRAELIAIIRVFETAPQSTKPLLIKTDSAYSISCIRDWIPNWQRRGWKTLDGSDVKNKAVIVYLSHLLEQRGLQGQRVHLQHVRGHAGIAGNEGADVLAGMGASKPAMPERDWSFPDEPHPRAIGKHTSVGFQVEESDLLSLEEMDRMLADGELD